MKIGELKHKLFMLLADINDPEVEAGDEVDILLGDLEYTKEQMVNKLDSIAWALETYRATRQSTKERIVTMQEKQKSIETAIQRLNNYILSSVREVGGEINTDEYSFKIKKSPHKVLVEYENLIPSEYTKIVESSSLDKKKILVELKKGTQIPGCKLVQGDRVEIK